MIQERIISPRVEFLNGKLVDNKLFNDSIISISTQKSIDTFVGTGEIRIIPNLGSQQTGISNQIDEWYSNIDLMDVLNLTIEPVTEKQPHWLFKGCVDQCFRSKTQMNNSTNRGVVIRFSDLLSKLLAKDELAFLAPLIFSESGNKTVAMDLNEPRLIKTENTPDGLFTRDRLAFLSGYCGKGYNNETKQNIFVGGTIDEAVKYILKNMQGTQIKIIRNGVETDVTNEIMGSVSISTDPLDAIWKIDLTDFQGTIYEMLMNVIDQQFYELWIETIQDKSTLFLRRKPFLKEDWDQVQYHTIEDDEIMDERLGISDYETKSVFRCFNDLEIFGSQSSFAGRYGYNFPLLNANAVRKFGLRQMNGHSTVVNTRDMIERNINPDDATDDCNTIDFLQSTITRKRNMLYRWYGYPYFETGQLRIRGNQNIRIGHRVFLPDKRTRSGKLGMMLYVAGVNQNYSIFQPFQTSLNVVRGQAEDGSDVQEYFDMVVGEGSLIGERLAFNENDYATEWRKFYGVPAK